MKRRETLALGAALALPALPGLAGSAGAQGTPAAAAAAGLRVLPNHAAQPAKVLRYAFQIAETGFDPAQINDNYSRTITAHIFEALYTYDYLARPARIVPLTAEALPEVASDFRTWTIKLRPGIFFADDPAFKGQRRELVAQDYVFAFKRYADPAVKSPLWASVEDFKFLGLAALRQQALEQKKPFDYDKPIAGLRALDRYTLQFHVEDPQPRLTEVPLAVSDLFGAVAREVVLAYGDKIVEHPVGTGPFRLAQWRRSSLIVLERNPTYRLRLWHAEPVAGDAEGQAIAAKLKGRRLPLLDRVEISIIEESQPRWLSFLNRQADLIKRVPPEFIDAAMPAGRVAPNLAKQGIRGLRVLMPEVVMTYFNMDDATVGGLQPARVALRRAICLGVDLEREIRLVRHGMAIPAQSPVLPHTTGYDPAFKSENSEYNPARAKALLDMYGYVDRNADGWREQPDGSPLLLEYATSPDQVSRQLNEQWQKNMHAIGIKIEFKAAKWPENLKAARAGKLMMWGLGSLASGGDGQGLLARYYGKQAGQQNLSRFNLPAFDAIYDKMSVMPDGPERLALFDQAKRLAIAYAPYKLHVHRFVADMMQPWVEGYRRPLFWNEWWHMVDIDPARRADAA